MLKTMYSALAISAAALAFAPVAMADVSVSVEGSANGWHKHHHRVATNGDEGQRHHGRVYYSGDYAYVARNGGATIVHAYPGVDVYVGASGGVDVNVGY